jgi:hypothetical protein
MTNDNACDRLRKLFATALTQSFQIDLQNLLARRKSQLWIIGIDSAQGKLIDICGVIGSPTMNLMNASGTPNNDAGFRADIQTLFTTISTTTDAFLLNTDHFNDPDEKVVPLIVHEQAHYLEQIDEDVSTLADDEANGLKILEAMDYGNRQHHNARWATLLSAASRNMVTKRHTSHATVREFLEAAIPEYDRPDWTKVNVKEP